MNTKLKPEDFLVKNHCHSAIHLKEVWSPDMIEGNHYDRLLLAMEDYANEKAKHHVTEALKAARDNVKIRQEERDYGGVRAGCKYYVPVIDEFSIINAYPIDQIK